MTVLWIIVAIVVVVGFWAVLAFNGLVRRRNRTRRHGRRSTSSSSGGTT